MTQLQPDEMWDVLVIGGGGCGLSAAVRAAQGGARVLLVEKAELLGGNTAYSVGSIPGAGTRHQKEAGVDDSPRRFRDDLVSHMDGHCDEAIVERLCEVSSQLIDWLVDDLGITLLLTKDYRHVGHSVTRLHNPPTREGRELVNGLAAAAERHGVTVMTATPVTRLTKEGATLTAALETPDGPRVVSAPAAILATDGFGADEAMKEAHAPRLAGLPYYGAPGNTGDGIRWGAALGAQLENMDTYLAYGAMAQLGDAPASFESLFSWTVPEKGGIIVDLHGRRFGDEGLGYSAFTDEMIEHAGGIGHVVFDQRILDYVTHYEQRFRLLATAPDSPIHVEHNVEALAQHCKIPAAALATTIEEYNSAALGDAPDPFGRADFGFAPLQPPYAIARITPGVFTTLGGLTVDGDAQVLDQAGHPIGGLYAGGGTAAGLSRVSGGRAYVSGVGLLTALAFGMLAGSHAARTVAGESA